MISTDPILQSVTLKTDSATTELKALNNIDKSLEYTFYLEAETDGGVKAYQPIKLTSIFELKTEPYFEKLIKKQHTITIEEK